jgi:hypothetical protein
MKPFVLCMPTMCLNVLSCSIAWGSRIVARCASGGGGGGYGEALEDMPSFSRSWTGSRPCGRNDSGRKFMVVEQDSEYTPKTRQDPTTKKRKESKRRKRSDATKSYHPTPTINIPHPFPNSQLSSRRPRDRIEQFTMLISPRRN